MEVFVETNRFLLRNFEYSDVEGLFELESDPEVYKYLGYAHAQNRDQVKAIIKHVRNQYVENGIGRWVIIEKDTNNFIGWTGLKYETEIRKDFNYYDIGYRLIRKYWGQGIGTETALASLKYGFEVLKLEEIYGAAHTENIASNKILQKIGLNFFETFEFEGVPHHFYKAEKEAWLSSSNLQY